jgi:hypothetical protein
MCHFLESKEWDTHKHIKVLIHNNIRISFFHSWKSWEYDWGIESFFSMKRTMRNGRWSVFRKYDSKSETLNSMNCVILFITKLTISSTSISPMNELTNQPTNQIQYQYLLYQSLIQSIVWFGLVWSYTIIFFVTLSIENNNRG